MTTDEEMIVAVRDMSPQELNTFVAMKLVAIVKTQEKCNQACQTRLALMESQLGRYNKLEGWMKGLWLVTGGIVAVTLAALWKMPK